MELSAIVLDWKRPANVQRIVASLRACGVPEITVWNNNPRHTAAVAGARCINSSCDFGLYSRFAAGLLAAHDCLLFQDDDLLLPEESLVALYRSWREQPLRVHGIFGRVPRSDGSYCQDVNCRGADVDVVLTRAAVVHKQFLPHFFLAARRFERIMREGKPAGNGEDILLSYVVRKETGRPNRVHGLGIEELPAPDAIHQRWDGHCAHRSKIMRACLAWCGEQPPYVRAK